MLNGNHHRLELRIHRRGRRGAEGRRGKQQREALGGEFFQHCLCSPPRPSASSMRKVNFARPDVAGLCPPRRPSTIAPRDRSSIRTRVERMALRCMLVSVRGSLDLVLTNSATTSKGQDADRSHQERGIEEQQLSDRREEGDDLSQVSGEHVCGAERAITPRAGAARSADHTGSRSATADAAGPRACGRRR